MDNVKIDDEDMKKNIEDKLNEDFLKDVEPNDTEEEECEACQ